MSDGLKVLGSGRKKLFYQPERDDCVYEKAFHGLYSLSKVCCNIDPDISHRLRLSHTLPKDQDALGLDIFCRFCVNTLCHYSDKTPPPSPCLCSKVLLHSAIISLTLPKTSLTQSEQFFTGGSGFTSVRARGSYGGG